MILEARGITKRFPGLLALDHVDLEVNGGDVHAVVGQNGAGKTTLMKILFGLTQPDEGTISLRGRRAHIRSPHDAMAQGIGMVHQTRRLVASHTVFENLILGHPRSRGLIDLRRARDDVEALCRRHGLAVDLGAKVWQLPEGQKQWVEILKALYAGARILILDEPTSALTLPEVTALLGALRTLVRDQGVTVLLVTHKLPIALAVSRTVTVLRAGRVVARMDAAEATEQTLIQHMIGHDVSLNAAGEARETRGPLLRVDGLSARSDKGLPALRDVSFALDEGEILGIAGVTGNGQDELAQVLAGLRPAQAGRVRFEDRDITRAAPAQRWRMGIGYVPAERLEVASIGAFSLVDNVALNYHFDPGFHRRGLFDYPGLGRLTRQIVSTFDVKARHPHAPARHLSGGNLQKLIMGRVLSRTPRLLIAHLPTQGLDVEATAFVRGKLLEARAAGAAVLLISEDLDEILSLSDRVVPMYEGRFVAFLPRARADADTVGAMMAGVP